MKLKEAMEIINKPNPKGYYVSFEWAENGMLRGDYFPDVYAGEAPIDTEEKAWDLARRFAARTVGRAVNIYVCVAGKGPVPGYKERMIRNRS